MVDLGWSVALNKSAVKEQSGGCIAAPSLLLSSNFGFLSKLTLTVSGVTQHSVIPLFQDASLQLLLPCVLMHLNSPCHV